MVHCHGGSVGLLSVILTIAHLAAHVRLAAAQTAVTGWTQIFSTFYGEFNLNFESSLSTSCQLVHTAVLDLFSVKGLILNERAVTPVVQAAFKVLLEAGSLLEPASRTGLCSFNLSTGLFSSVSICFQILYINTIAYTD